MFGYPRFGLKGLHLGLSQGALAELQRNGVIIIGPFDFKLSYTHKMGFKGKSLLLPPRCGFLANFTGTLSAPWYFYARVVKLADTHV
jgi:hypothetical protein